MDRLDELIELARQNLASSIEVLEIMTSGADRDKVSASKPEKIVQEKPQNADRVKKFEEAGQENSRQKIATGDLRNW